MKCSAQHQLPIRIILLAECLWLLCVHFGSHVHGADHASSPIAEPGTTPTQANLAEGWILMNERGCFQCHQGLPGMLNTLPAFDAPHLENIRLRLNKKYLGEWLEHPHAKQPGTRMPSLLHDIPRAQREKIKQVLADFLWQPSAIQPESAPLTIGNALDGEKHFKSLGCVACHASLDERPSDKHSLAHVGEKYTTKGLASFLLNPQEVRPGFRMPNFHLTPQEALDLTTYLTPVRHPFPNLPSSDTSSIEAGRQWFEKLQCHQCHTLKENEPAPLPSQGNFSKNSLHSGCLSDTPQAGVPWYDLTSEQRDQIRKALSHSMSNDKTPLSLGIEAYMKTLRCDACHARGDLAGPSEVKKEYFTTTGNDLEDEGKFPPHLDGVGRKIKFDALSQTIQGDLRARPYMNTRMPDFGEIHATFLATNLAQTDADPNEQPTPRNGLENQVGRNMWGRALVGISGLGCIQCHPLNGHRSLGIQAMDLKHAAERLRAPWFRDYLLDPAKFRPGTRMPAFWPEGKPSINGHGGSSERQIDSIWVYLNELDQSRLPEGMERKDDFKLVPHEKPIVFRTFMEQAGLHAIAVGFPESFHVAFDAKNCRWSLAWKGDFLSAESTWDDRFTPLASPLGERLAWFPDSDATWSTASKKDIQLETNRSFLGYQLDDHGIPTFSYRIGPSVTVKDRIHAVERGIHRQLQWSPDMADIELLVSTEASLIKHSDDHFRFADTLDIEIVKGIPEIRNQSKQSELWLKPILEKGLLRLEYVIEEREP